MIISIVASSLLEMVEVENLNKLLMIWKNLFKNVIQLYKTVMGRKEGLNMNDKLHNLANKINNINYSYDTYSYMDNLDTTEAIGEGRQKATKEKFIYINND